MQHEVVEPTRGFDARHLPDGDRDDRADVVEGRLFPHGAQRRDGKIRTIECFEEERSRTSLVVRIVICEKVDGVVPQIERANRCSELPERRGCAVVAFEEWAVSDDRYE
jgi:hypothetical protein